MPEQIRQHSSSGRRLVAIIFTDIVGYTALMGSDENKAMQLLRHNRELQKALVKKYGGTWLKEMGDGAMASFPTASDAIYCALDIQQQLNEDEDLKLRIGIHLGEILVESGDVFGDGVNIAYRLQSIADPGGIYISDTVQKSVRSKNDIQTVYLGELELKNVDYAIKTFALRGQDLPRPKKTAEKHLSGRFLAELQRRNVIRAGLIYIALAFVIYNVLQWTVLPPLILNSIYGLLLLGFPVSIYLAWNYEKSPEGFVHVTSSKSWENPYSDRQKKPFTGNSFIIVLLLLILVIVGYPRLADFGEKESYTVSTANLAKSIAILPLRNLSNDQEQGYFAEGVADMIRTKLSKIEALSVTSMQSVLKYADSEKTSPEIGMELDVNYILEGSVLREGNTVRLFAQLIDVKNDRHLWSETYDRDLSEILKIQSEIAQEISAALEIELTRSETGFTRNIEKMDPEILDLVLAGNHNLNRLASTGNKNFLSLAYNQFHDAHRKDPMNLEAKYGLGWTYFQKSWYGEGSEWLDSAQRTAYEILALNENIPEVNHLLGRINYVNGEYQEAKTYLEETIKLDPNNANAMFRLSYLYMAEKNFEKGIPLRIKSMKLDPSNSENAGNLYDNLGTLFVEAGMYGEAEQMFEKQIELYPDKTNAYYWSIWNLWLQDRIGEGRETFENFKEIQNFNLDEVDNLNSLDGIAFSAWLAGDYEISEKTYLIMMDLIKDGFQEQSIHHIFRHRLAYIYWLKGDTLASNKLLLEHITMLEDLTDKVKSRQGLEYDLAAAYTFMGNKEKAYEWLDKMPYWYVTYILIRKDPLFNTIRQEPRFNEIMSKQESETLEIRNYLEQFKVGEDMKWMLSR